MAVMSKINIDNDIIDPPVPKAYLNEIDSGTASGVKASCGRAGLFSKLSGTAARLFSVFPGFSGSAANIAVFKALPPHTKTNNSKLKAALPKTKTDNLGLKTILSGTKNIVYDHRHSRHDASVKSSAVSSKAHCELPFFNVDGMLGGNQELFSDPWMKIGGCAAVTACDLCIYMDMYKGTKGLYPYDIAHISCADYERFAMLIKPYLRPRYSGINRTSTYIGGLSAYLEDHGYKCDITDFDLNSRYSEARSFVTDSIDAGFPVAYLNLYHRDPAFSDFVWHWFLLAGYAVYSDTMMVKVISYGECYWFDFARLLNTGHHRKGGMVRINAVRKLDSLDA